MDLTLSKIETDIEDVIVKADNLVDRKRTNPYKTALLQIYTTSIK